jgi:hypothetical protein
MIMSSTFTAVGFASLESSPAIQNFIEENLRTATLKGERCKDGRFLVFVKDFGENILLWFITRYPDDSNEYADLISLYPGFRGQVFQDFQLEEMFFNPAMGKGILFGKLRGRDNDFSVPLLIFAPEFLQNCLWFADEFLEISLVGLAFEVNISTGKDEDSPAGCFVALQEDECHYFFRGRVLEKRTITNPATEERFYWFYIDTMVAKLGIVVSAAEMPAEVPVNSKIEGICWLQGFIKEEYTDVYEHMHSCHHHDKGSGPLRGPGSRN